MTLLTPLGVKGHIWFKLRVMVGVSASHYGANGAIHISAGRKCPPVQLQRVRTSTGTIGVPDAASNCYLHKGMHANVKGSALMQVTIASCIGHSNGARACPDPL